MEIGKPTRPKRDLTERSVVKVKTPNDSVLRYKSSGDLMRNPAKSSIRELSGAPNPRLKTKSCVSMLEQRKR